MTALRHFWRIAPDSVERCRTNPAFLEDVITGGEEGSIEVFNIDEAWDAIHFLISANRAFPDLEDEPDTAVYDHAIRGARLHRGLDVGHGAAGVLSPDEVRDVAGALSALEEKDLKARLDPESMTMAEVKPEAWKAHPWPWLWEHFVRLREFYQRASSEGNGVATWVTLPVE